MSRRVSGLGKGKVINHKMKRGADTAADIKLGWPHTFKESLKNRLRSDFKWYYTQCATLHRLNSHIHWSVLWSPPVHCVVNPLQVSAWLVVTTGNAVRQRAKQTPAPLLTPYGDDTNSGAAAKVHLLLLLTSLFSLTETLFHSWCFFANL